MKVIVNANKAQMGSNHATFARVRSPRSLTDRRVALNIFPPHRGVPRP
jgi:hypothetical protein